MKTISRKDNTEFAWLAGLIDGDGCISFAKIKQSSARNTQREYYVPYVSITTTCITTKNYLESMFKEYQLPLYINLKPSRNIHQKPVWRLTAQGLTRTEKLLNKIKDYLITKKEECELMLEFIQERKDLQFQKVRGPREKDIVNRMHEIKLSRNTVLNPQRLYAGLSVYKNKMKI